MPKLRIRTHDGKPLSNANLEKGVLSLSKAKDATSVKYENLGVDASSQEFTLQAFTETIERTQKAFDYALDALRKKNKEFNIDSSKKFLNDVKEVYLYRLKQLRNIKSQQQLSIQFIQDTSILLEDFLKQNKIPFNPKKLLSIADNYLQLKSPKEKLITITSFGEDFLVQMEEPQFAFSEGQLRDLLSAKSNHEGIPHSGSPRWYQIMESEERFLFDETMSSVKTEEEARKVLQSISSKHRTIPGVANYSKHKLAIVNKHGTVLHESDERYRSSMLASRDIPKEEAETQLNLTIANALHVIKTTLQHKAETMAADPLYQIDDHPNIALIQKTLSKFPVLWQTLISPIGESASNLFNLPDERLYQAKLDAIEILKKSNVTIEIGATKINITPNLFHTNHPLNMAYRAIGTGKSFGCASTIKQTKALIDSIKYSIKNATQALQEKASQLESDVEKQILIQKIMAIQQNPQFELIQLALPQLEALVDKTPATIFFGDDDHRRELHLAALEELVTSKIGIAYSSCVSGKDRRALSTIYADALEIYFNRYQKMFEYQDSLANHQRFINIFAHLFLSRHQQVHAGQNAPGANGCKTPFSYLPKDFQQAIRKLDNSNSVNILEESNVLANNNELDSILKKYPPNQLSAYATNPQKYLSEQNEKNQQDSLRKSRQFLAVYSPQVADAITALVGKITDIINSDYWNDKGTKLGVSTVKVMTKAPTGITQLREILKTYEMSSAPKNTGAEINLLISLKEVITNYQHAKNKIPLFSSSSSSETAQFYQLIKEIGKFVALDVNTQHPNFMLAPNIQDTLQDFYNKIDEYEIAINSPRNSFIQ